MTNPPAPTTDCQCGCFAPTRGGSYLPGHDARHVAVLASYVQAGTHTPAEALSVFRDKRPALHNKLAQRLAKNGWAYDPATGAWSREAAAPVAAPKAKRAATEAKAPTNKLTITLDIAQPRHIGHGHRLLPAFTLAGHPHIDGNLVVQAGEGFREICDACSGTGWRPGYEHVDNGRCWPCGTTGLGPSVGTGSAIEVARKIRDRAQAADRRAAKRAKEAAAQRDAQQAWLAANPELAAIAEQFGRLGDCEHGGDCGREACWDIRQQVQKTHDPLLLELAGKALYNPLSDRQAEVLASLVEAHGHKEAARAERQAKLAERKWLGVENDKVTVTGKLAAPRHFDGAFAASTLYRLTTADGDVAVWFRTGFHTFAAGEEVTLTGTIKKLEDGQYGKETVLTRCKIS